MSNPPKQSFEQSSASFDDFIQNANYSLLDILNPDPESTKDGEDHRPRQVRSGHFVPVTPKPLPQPTYISHSKTFFAELGLKQELALNEEFKKLFSGDLSETRDPMPHLDGQRGMPYPFMELNIINNVHLEMAMATGMVAQFRSSKESLKANVGRCN